MTYQEISSNKRKSIFLIIIFTIFLIGLSIVFTLGYGGGFKEALSISLFAIIVSLVSAAISYYSGDKIALWTSGAKPISQEENPYVYRLVENLCITSGMPVPKIHIIPDPAINAFATGRSPDKASIAITEGAIEKLENEELEGVIAHELSHIKNYDIRFMMLVAVLVGAISILANIFMRVRIKSNSKNNNAALIFFIVGIVLAIISPIVAELVKLAISRKREFLADASGSLLTRYPEGLARALEKIEQENMPMRNPSAATAHLFLSNPFKSSKIKSLFSTHPPVAERVKRLRSMGGI